MEAPKQPDPRKDQFKAIAKYSGLGAEMAMAVVGTTMLGQWLDNRAGHETPYYTLGLGSLGLIYIFYRIFKIASSK